MRDKFFPVILSGMVLFAVTCIPAYAADKKDDILTTIDEAVRQYKTGDYAGAVVGICADVCSADPAKKK